MISTNITPINTFYDAITYSWRHILMPATRGLRRERNIKMIFLQKEKKNPRAVSFYNAAVWWLAGHVPLYLDWQDTSVEGTGWLQARGNQVWIFQQVHATSGQLDGGLGEGNTSKAWGTVVYMCHSDVCVTVCTTELLRLCPAPSFLPKPNQCRRNNVAPPVALVLFNSSTC